MLFNCDTDVILDTGARRFMRKQNCSDYTEPYYARDALNNRYSIFKHAPVLGTQPKFS